jgi:isopenicillin N synthase-like dioxygenase
LLKLPTEIDTLIVEQSIELFKTPSNALNIALGDFLQKQLVSTNERLNNFFVRVSQFDEPQRQAICHFLVYVRDEHNEPSLKQEADLAIQRYWFQFE